MDAKRNGAAGALAGFIKERRVAMGLTQAQLEQRAGLAPRTVSNVESGRSALPTPDHRRRLARALDVPPAELLVAAGELTVEEVVEGARALGRPEPTGRSPTPGWVDTLVDRIGNEPETSPRARLLRAAVGATQQEAGCLLATFDNLPPSEARENRRRMPWPEYRPWRDRHDAAEAL